MASEICGPRSNKILDWKRIVYKIKKNMESTSGQPCLINLLWKESTISTSTTKFIFISYIVLHFSQSHAHSGSSWRQNPELDWMQDLKVLLHTTMVKGVIIVCKSCHSIKFTTIMILFRDAIRFFVSLSSELFCLKKSSVNNLLTTVENPSKSFCCFPRDS